MSGVSLKRLQSLTDASFRPPPMGDTVDFGRTFGTVKRVAFQPFRRGVADGEGETSGVGGDEGGDVGGRGDGVRPPATYKSFLKKAATEPVVASGTRMQTVWRPSFNKPQFRTPSFGKPNFNNAGKWIDQRFDFLPKQPTRQTTSSIPPIPMTELRTTPSSPSSPTAAAAVVDPIDRANRQKYRIWTKRNDSPWSTAPRPPRIPLNIKRRGTTMSKAVVRGWDRVVIVSSSFSNVVSSKIPRKHTKGTAWAQNPAAMETTVRRVTDAGDGVQEVHEVGGRMSLEDSISEEFHTDEEIVEAETVTGELVLEHLHVENMTTGKDPTD
jgi:hypothetical protein